MAKKGSGDAPKGPATISNRRATYDYQVLDTVECGLVLVGSEVKSLYLGRATLTDAFCRVRDGEMWMIASDIEPYSHSSVFGHERRRDRKLLLHRREIEKLERATNEKGISLIPLRIYFKGGKAKVALGLCKGKKTYDKREAITEREIKREEARAKSGRHD